MNWINSFEGLVGLSEQEKQLLTEQSTIMNVPANTTVFGPGTTPDSLMLLLEGSVRVQQVSEKGREIVLYRVRAGESCVMTTSCLLAMEKYTAHGVADTQVKAVAIPYEKFDLLIAQSAPFRQFVFAAYSRRITELFHIIEDVAFQRVDIRLAERLIDLSMGSNTISVTHQQLAAELGTAREVISRQLSEFQRRGLVKQTRGVVELTNRQQIQSLAAR